MTDGPLRALLAPNPSPMTLDGTRSWVVGRRRPVVVDPGPADPSHVEALLALLDGAVPAAILLTHHHPDHAAAAPRLAAATGAPVMMAAGAMDVGFPAIHADRWLRDGDRIDTDTGSIRAVATPGHVPEHLCFHVEGEGVPEGGSLLVGDLLMGVGDTTLVAWPEGDLAAYLASLDRVAALAPAALLPAHGPPIADPREAVDRYLRHRAHRVSLVQEALAQTGPARADELVGRVYGAALDPRLRAAAEASLRAILHFLEARGRLRLDSDGRATVSDDRPVEGLLVPPIAPRP